MKRLILNADKLAARKLADSAEDEWQLAYDCFLDGVMHARRLERDGHVLGRPPTPAAFQPGPIVLRDVRLTFTRPELFAPYRLQKVWRGVEMYQSGIAAFLNMWPSYEAWEDWDRHASGTM